MENFSKGFSVANDVGNWIIKYDCVQPATHLQCPRKSNEIRPTPPSGLLTSSKVFVKYW